MSKKQEGLYLPLAIDLSAWEQSLAKLDAPLQQKMRELQSEASLLDLQYKVEIGGAKAAGDTVRALNLEFERLSKSYEIQQAKVLGLSNALREQIKLTGEDSVEVRNLSRVLLQQTDKLNKIKIQMNEMQSGLGGKIIDGLSNVSPAFARVTQSAVALKTALASAGGGAAALLGPVAAVGIAAVGMYKGLEAAAGYIQDVAGTAAEANEPIFLLAERFNMTYAEAEKLRGIFTIDGTNAEAFATALQKLNKQQLKNSEENNLAAEMLSRYNVELRNADGTQKSYIEQTKALADAYKEAKEHGEGLDFVTATLGSSGSQFVHLLNGFDDYTNKYDEVNTRIQADYKMSHELLDSKKQLIESERQLAAARGEAYTNAAIEANKERIRQNKEEAKYIQQNSKILKEYSENVKIVGQLWERVTGTAKKAGLSLMNIAAAGVADWAELLGLIEKTAEQPQPQQREVKKQTTSIVDDRAAKKAEQDAQKKLADANEKIQKALREARSDEYQKQLNALNDEIEAYNIAGVKKADIEELYALKKEEIDKRFSEKHKQEQQRIADEAQRAQQQVSDVFLSETEKRINAINKQRDAWIRAGADEVQATQAAQKQIANARLSEAERTLRDNVQLIRKMQVEQNRGGDWESRVKTYADEQYKKRLGVRDSDIAALHNYGIDAVQQLANSRDRVLSSFAQQNRETQQQTKIEAPVTVHFDNTVVEDVDAMSKLADKVAAVITPAITQALHGGGNGYVY